MLGPFIGVPLCTKAKAQEIVNKNYCFEKYATVILFQDYQDMLQLLQN
jgi:hypothetical protein